MYFNHLLPCRWTNVCLYGANCPASKIQANTVRWLWNEFLFLFQFHTECGASSKCVECLASGSCTKCKKNFALRLWRRDYIGYNVCDKNCENCVEPKSQAQVCKSSAGDDKMIFLALCVWLLICFVANCSPFAGFRWYFDVMIYTEDIVVFLPTTPL